MSDLVAHDLWRSTSWHIAHMIDICSNRSWIFDRGILGWDSCCSVSGSAERRCFKYRNAVNSQQETWQLRFLRPITKSNTPGTQGTWISYMELKCLWRCYLDVMILCWFHVFHGHSLIDSIPFESLGSHVLQSLPGILRSGTVSRISRYQARWRYQIAMIYWMQCNTIWYNYIYICIYVYMYNEI